MVTYLPRHFSLPSHPLQRILLPGPTQPPRKTRRVSSPKGGRMDSSDVTGCLILILFVGLWRCFDKSRGSLVYHSLICNKTRKEGKFKQKFDKRRKARGLSSSERGRHFAFLNFRCISYFDPLNLKWEIGPKPPSSELSGFEAFYINFGLRIMPVKQP